LGCGRGANRRGKRVKRCRESGKDSKEEFFYMRKVIYRQRIWELCAVIGFEMKRERERERERICMSREFEEERENERYL